jgi:mono/diheme cytochrome c family protein
VLLSKDLRPGYVLLTGIFALAGLGLLISLFFRLEHPPKSRIGQKNALISRDSADSNRLAQGEMLYQVYCATCHGVSADGRGEAARLLDPRPRDFHLGKYRIISSSNQIPFREDIIGSIRDGLPGTSMPSWIHLGQPQIELLADYVWSITKSAERQRLEARLTAQKKGLKNLEMLLANRLTPNSPATPGLEPKFTRTDLEKIRPMYLEACGKCHGADGAGLQDPSWKTEEGFVIASRNFKSGVFKGGGRGTDIYRRIYAGIPGTPMPGFASSLSDEDIWHLVHYVQMLAGPARANLATTAASQINEPRASRGN